MAQNKPRKIKIGALLKSEVTGKDGKSKQLLSLALGNRSNKTEYDLHVEIVVKDSKGNVVATQTDGFVDLVDPRLEPEDLFNSGFIDESKYNQMVENVSKLSSKVRYYMRIKTSA